MQRAGLLSRESILDVGDLGLEQTEVSSPAPRQSELQASDIHNALERYNGVVSRAAKSLGISRQSFYRRMEAHGLKN